MYCMVYQKRKLDFMNFHIYVYTYIEIFTCCAFQPIAEDSRMFFSRILHNPHMLISLILWACYFQFTI